MKLSPTIIVSSIAGVLLVIGIVVAVANQPKVIAPNTNPAPSQTPAAADPKSDDQDAPKIDETTTPTPIIPNPMTPTPTSDKAVTMPNGLIIDDTLAGTGEAVKTGDTVTIHYTGMLTDGTVFDSSLPRNQPFVTQIGVGQVIQGWDEGLIGMKVGGKRTLTIPSELGYGARGAGASIPPNATLIFELELLGTKS